MTENQKKIYFRLDGGLGNQLSEYAASRYIEKKLKCIIYYDLYYLNKSKKKHEKLKLGNLYKNKTEISCWKSKASRIINRFLYKFKINPIVIFGYIFYFESYPITVLDNVKYIIEGFWQKKNYYSDEVIELISDQLTKEIDFNNNILINFIKSINKRTLAVHVRRGDFITNRNYFIRQQFALSNYYYTKAISNFLDEVDKIIIFTDDEINYQEILPPISPRHCVNVVNKNDLTDLESFYLISMCNKIIIANSTFSLWAAIISKFRNANNVVIAPCKWHRNRPHDLEIIPNNFIISKEF